MSTDPVLQRWADAEPTPWRNGGGVTRELVSSPAGHDEFDWRISIADVTASGDFSRFPGVDRTMVLLDGSELTLTVDGAVHSLARHQPFEFDGGRPTSCTVPSGPAQVLNVMTRSGRYRSDVTVLDAADRWPASDAVAQLLIPLVGPVTVTTADDRPLTLARFDVLRTPSGSTSSLTGVGPVARIEIHRQR